MQDRPPRRAPPEQPAPAAVALPQEGAGMPPARPPLAHGLVSAAIIVAALYFGSDLLVPLTLAILLGFVLSPMVSWLKRHGLPRTVAVFAVMALALAVVAASAFLMFGQLRQLARDVPAYEANVTQKLRALGTTLRQPGLFDELARVFSRVEREIDRAQAPAQPPPAAGRPARVEVVSVALTPLQRLSRWADTVATPLAMAGIVLVLVVLILLDRGELRDRALRLLGTDLHRGTDALNDAARRVSRYLTMQLLVNAVYGLPLALGLWFIGVPGALVWGLLAAVLRFVPYVGPVIGALFPLALAVAIDPGWNLVLWTLALIVTLEPISNNVVEPWLYGASTGMSALSLILAAMFWTALWGPVGLILSTPITVVALVLGHHLPQLRFLEVLLGSAHALDEPTRLHQRLLAGDVEAAVDMAEELAAETSPQHFYDAVGLGALRLASGAHATVATAVHRHRVLSGMEQVLEELREQHPAAPGLPVRVACIGGRWAVDVLAAEMAAHALGLQRVGARVMGMGAMSTAYFDQLDLRGIEVVCVHYFAPDPSTLARYFVRRLKRRWPDVDVVLATWGVPADDDAGEALAVVGADVTVATLDELVSQVQSRLVDTPAAGYVPAPLPENEPARLAALQASGLLAPALRGAFDTLSKRVADAFDCPRAEIALLGAEAELVHGSATAMGRAEAGEPEPALPRSDALASHVAALDEPLVVPDVARDARFAEHPALRAQGIRFYAAAPLRAPGGEVLGVLCVMDTAPRTLTPRDRMLLERLAGDVVRLARPA